MKRIVFSLPGNESVGAAIAEGISAIKGDAVFRKFPDEESYVRILNDVRDHEVTVVCSLDRPDPKFLLLYFLCSVLKELGATKIILVTPYLPYMRQDHAFNPGEAVSANYFATLLSGFVDQVITVDPHLHRINSLDEIMSIPSKTINASPLIAAWIKENIKNPILIGPDMESEQWLAPLSDESGSPYIILNKKRHGDQDVEVSIPDLEKYKNHVPVLVDDIISTAGTMIETIGHLHNLHLKKPVCICVHPVFAGNSFSALESSGAERIISCNTIHHHSNLIDISSLLIEALSNKKSIAQ